MGKIENGTIVNTEYLLLLLKNVCTFTKMPSCRNNIITAAHYLIMQ